MNSRRILQIHWQIVFGFIHLVPWSPKGTVHRQRDLLVNSFIHGTGAKYFAMTYSSDVFLLMALVTG